MLLFAHSQIFSKATQSINLTFEETGFVTIPAFIF
jgi:hypothetical protein